VENLLHCECGFQARGADEEGLVTAIIDHARDAHGMRLSRDEALLLAFRAALDANALPTTPRPATAEEEEA
jgi:hypothetical protein